MPDDAASPPLSPPVEVVDETSDEPSPDAEHREGEGEAVTQPSKLIRIASMVRNMLEEVRHAPLDEAGRRLLRQIHDKSLHELEDVLSPDLKAELAEVVFPFEDHTPSESELRIAQAQLVGWLEGLFHGIQATLFTQQMAAQAQMEQMRRRALPHGMPGAPRGAGERGTGYL